MSTIVKIVACSTLAGIGGFILGTQDNESPRSTSPKESHVIESVRSGVRKELISRLAWNKGLPRSFSIALSDDMDAKTVDAVNKKLAGAAARSPYFIGTVDSFGSPVPNEKFVIVADDKRPGKWSLFASAGMHGWSAAWQDLVSASDWRSNPWEPEEQVDYLKFAESGNRQQRKARIKAIEGFTPHMYKP